MHSDCITPPQYGSRVLQSVRHSTSCFAFVWWSEVVVFVWQMPKMANGKITPVATLKRKRESSLSTDYSFCLFCQETKHHILYVASKDGKNCVKEAAAERESLADQTYLSFLNRLKQIPDDDWCNLELIKWHKPCYIDFPRSRA